MVDTAPGQGHARRRPRRGLRITLIVLLSLLVLALLADRGADLVAENIAAGKLQTSQNLPNEPDVDINGFPFLTQVAAGKYDDVTVTATDVPVGARGGESLRLSKVVIDLHDTTVTDNFSRFHVERATAVGTVSYAELSSRLGVQITYAGDGRIRASKEITILGQTITPTITAKASVVGGALTFAGTQANGLGPLAGELARVSSEIFGDSIPLSGIPFDVRVQDVSLERDGLRLELTGNDLTYNR